MYKFIVFLFAFGLHAGTTLSAQNVTKTYTTKFVPASESYYVSPGPDLCVEAMAYGIEIEMENGTGFFRMDETDVDKLKEKIGDKEVEIEVSINEKNEPAAGFTGTILKITMNGVVIWEKK